MAQLSTPKLSIAVVQLPFRVGDIAANRQKVIDGIAYARDQLGADWVVFPELCLTGYPPDDLLLRSDFLDSVERSLAEIASSCHGITAVVGAPLRRSGRLHNSAVVLADGIEVARADKRCLPSYSVFDDNRHFAPGESPCVVSAPNGMRVAIAICEDLWFPEPVAEAAQQGADLVIGINASPYHQDKAKEREAVVAERAGETGLPIVYVNLVGGHDEIVYDGGSFALDKGGRTQARAPQFEDGVYGVEIDVEGQVSGAYQPLAEPDQATYAALVRGTADYVHGNGFTGVVLGLSGGIDSALTAAIAVDAFGQERVLGVMLPSRYTAQRSLDDAQAAAEALGIDYRVIPIEDLVAGYESALAPLFAGRTADVTEENIQARIRGNLVMAISNKLGLMLLAAGNKSELAVGYATLYGDMCGGFAPLKDVYKTQVYRLAEYRNRCGLAVPESIMTREPTAELRANQRDQDSLPPYPLLDELLRQYIEQDRGEGELVVEGLAPDEQRRVIEMLYRNEYKRRQGAPGVKVTRRAFGRDRRYPITSGWQGTAQFRKDSKIR
ncbi:NAD+ synthase [Halorhodospira halochloris]|uniref:NAD+ synthase n=1 Tax=Halorhodospira halochloris TaxID=1052 RepID=UPI00076F8472|nr:NAD+ synthase [Halorhodospira halochloris]MBK1652309.1 NAD+ synthase [Halorhodospira halochloris]